jgi:peptidoglycan/LPS O-acetylase OafA/YrhL
MPRLPMLDGWRGISILAVLLAHMLPLGPKRLQLNDGAGVFGMAIFFTLSGFLITSTLYFHPSVRTFVIRRLCRILPAAWLFMVIVLPFIGASPAMWRADMLFYTNLPPFHLAPVTAHLWSLCVEIQFYLGMALLFLLLRKMGFALLPILCVAITIGRIYTKTPVSIVTIFRVDEILSGATLAWLFHGSFAARLKSLLTRINPAIPLVLLFLSSHPAFPWLEYFRPYFAAITVGTTLFHVGTRWNSVLESRALSYLAAISYALYIWHPLMMHGWFRTGSKLVQYAKRPLAIALSFLVAHLSTFYFERHFIELGKRLTTTRKVKAIPAI